MFKEFLMAMRWPLASIIPLYRGGLELWAVWQFKLHLNLRHFDREETSLFILLLAHRELQLLLNYKDI